MNLSVRRCGLEYDRFYFDHFLFLLVSHSLAIFVLSALILRASGLFFVPIGLFYVPRSRFVLCKS